MIGSNLDDYATPQLVGAALSGLAKLHFTVGGGAVGAG